MQRNYRILLSTCFVALISAKLPAARAESDYEYAKVLLDLKSPSFSTDDLVERLAVKLEDKPDGKSEAKLIRANLKRRQAAELTVEKRVGALKEASELFKDAANDPKFRLQDTAKKDAQALSREISRASIEAAKGNPAEAQRMRGEAAKLIETEAIAHKTEAETAFPVFEAAYKAYTAEKARIDPKDEGKMPGPAIMLPLEKAFDAWIIADKKYVVARTEQIEMLDEADKKPREALAKEMTDHCKKRADDDVIGQFPVIACWYSFMQGRIFAAVANEDEATKSWNEALGIEAKDLPADLKKQYFAIRRQIVHDLIKMKMKSKKYSEVEDIFSGIKTDPLLNQLLDEDSGKELVIDYAKALTIPAESAGEYEKAVRALREAIARERNQQWQNTFARATAEILMDARTKRFSPHLSAQEWYDAARGFHLMGRYLYTQQYERLEKSTDPKEKALAPAKFEEAYNEYSNAVDYYRRAISEARRSDRTDLATRLEIEPKAWFEMGLSYMRMRHDYEAIIAYKAMRDTFLPSFRAKWLPDATREAKSYTPQVKAALTRLDLPKDKEGLLAKSGVNILIALEENEKLHKDPWNQSLKSKIIGESTSPLDPEGVNDKDYLIADGDSKQARSFADEARRATKAEVAAELWAKAYQGFVSAGDKFAKVKPDSPAYDYALVQVANNLTQAQRVLAEGHGADTAAKNEAESKVLAARALTAYQKYDEYEAAHATTDEKILTRRKKFRGAILLAQCSLFLGSGEYAKAVSKADEYISWEGENPPEKSAAQVAYLNKFHAYLAQAAAAQPPQNAPFLKGASQALTDLRSVNKTDNKLYVYMLNALSDRYNISAYQLEARKKDSTLSKQDIETLDEQINVAEKEVADLQGERVKTMELGKGDDLGLEDYSRLVYLFHKTGQIRLATDTAIKLLKKFDPENKNMRMPDDEKTWKPFLDKMLRVIHYEQAKEDRCKEEHKILVDYMYDTPAGAQLPENDPKRPTNDKLNENMEKALAKLEAIKNPAGEFKDVQTLKVGPEGTGKSFLATVEEEIQYRRKISAARDLLSDMALEVASQLKKEGKEDASKEYFDVAEQQIKILQELNGSGPSIEVKLAEIDIALGKTNDAMNRLLNVKNIVSPNTALYFTASRRISELHFAAKKWKDAAEYPEFVAVTMGFNNKIVKERWPGMQEFLRQCYENGAPMPAALKKKFAAPAAGDAPASVVPTDEPKAEPAKAPAATETKPAGIKPAAK